jgi:threonine-phosphate decarboxylase
MTAHLFQSEERQHSPSVFQVSAAAGGRPVVDFCYLSNKFFPTPELLAELGANLEDMVRNYPSMQQEQARLAGELTGFDPRHILVGNGASELIHLVAARFGSRWLMAYPSYMEYENVIRDFNKHLQLHPLLEAENFEVNLPRLLADIEEHRIDAVALPNPNSPTGRLVPIESLLELLTRCAHLKAVVIDESFIEFASVDRAGIPTLCDRLGQFPNLIIMRSLGKDFGVCGLRLGLVATANLSFLGELRRFLPIWNISPMAERFLRLCLNHRAAYEAARVRCIEETQSLARRLAAIPPLHVYDTRSNFILFKIRDPRTTSVQLRDHLLAEHGLYVRDCSRKLGLGPQFIRVGTNVPAANQRLVDAIAGYFARRA